MKKNKVGLITFHFPTNYGSALQAFAMFKLLVNLGYTTSVIDYRPSYHTIRYNTYNSFSDYYENKGTKLMPYIFAKYAYKNLKGFFDFNKKRKNIKFRNFVTNNLVLTKRYRYPSEIQDEFDLYISGSDQIWNYKCTADREYGGVYDKAYFLKFAKNKKKIAYAVSAQHGELRSDLDNEVCSLINDFSYISTREEALATSIKNMGRSDVMVVLDPTLLLDKKYYEEIETNIRIKEEYILVYNLAGKYSNTLKDVLQYVKKVLQLKVVDISAKPYEILDSIKDSTCDPPEFISYIHNAKYIVTDSFHAVAFSIIFNKNFTCTLRDDDDERIRNILHICGLEQRLCENIQNKIELNDINFDIVNSNLKPYKEKSINFLLNSLEE